MRRLSCGEVRPSLLSLQSCLEDQVALHALAVPCSHSCTPILLWRICVISAHLSVFLPACPSIFLLVCLSVSDDPTTRCSTTPCCCVPSAPRVTGFAWIHQHQIRLQRCYEKSVALREGAAALARRDVLRFWSCQVARLARVLAEWAHASSQRRGTPLPRVYYHTSPRPATEILIGHAASGEALRFDRPLSSCAKLPPIDPSAPYSHDLYSTLNDLSAAAFRAAGHAVIDHECAFGIPPMAGTNACLTLAQGSNSQLRAHTSYLNAN